MTTGLIVDAEVLGEKRLAWAVLERAILDAIGQWKILAIDTILVQKQAWAWINSEVKQSEPFSCGWCCEVLDLPICKIRKFIETHSGQYYSPSYKEEKVINWLVDSTDGWEQFGCGSEHAGKGLKRPNSGRRKQGTSFKKKPVQIEVMRSAA